MNGKEALTEAAVTILNDEGLSSVTIRSVATATSYGRSAVEHHFGSKAKLLDAIHLRAVETFFTDLTDFERDHSDEPLGTLLSRFRSTFPGYWELIRFRRCPAIEARQCPSTTAYLATLSVNLDSSPERMVDAMLHQAFSLHDHDPTAPDATRLYWQQALS